MLIPAWTRLLITQAAIPAYDAVILPARACPSDTRRRSRLYAVDRKDRGDAMRKMNMAVDRDHESPESVARRFLDGVSR